MDIKIALEDLKAEFDSDPATRSLGRRQAASPNLVLWAASSSYHALGRVRRFFLIAPPGLQ